MNGFFKAIASKAYKRSTDSILRLMHFEQRFVVAEEGI